VDGMHAGRFDETARWRATRYVSSYIQREMGAAPIEGDSVRRAGYRGRSRVGGGASATRAPRGAGLELKAVNGGRRDGGGSAALDFAMGAELTRRSR
jgi:hypothetical protein